MIAVDSVWFNDTVEITVGKVRETYVEFVIECDGAMVADGFEDRSGVVILKWHSLVGCPSDI